MSSIIYALQFSSHCFPMSAQFPGSSRLIYWTTSLNKSNPLLLNRTNVSFHSCHSVISLGQLQCVPSGMVQKAISSGVPQVKAVDWNISMNTRSWPFSSKPISKVLTGGESVPSMTNELRRESEKGKHSTNLSVSTSMMKDSSTETEVMERSETVAKKETLFMSVSCETYADQ